jgi:hypothetical protein
MKKLFFVVAFAAASVAVKAQDTSPLKFSIGLEAALPVGDFADSHSFGIGGSLQGDYSVAEKLAVTLNAGYTSYTGKKYDVPGFGSVKAPAIGLIPVLAGFKYALTDQLYGSAQIGATFSDQKNSGTAFTYAPGLGYKFSENFDALLKYTGYSQDGGTLSTVGLRVAYTF